MNYRIYPPDDLPEAEVTLPLSKSESNRALIINALSVGDATMPQMAQCTDTEAVMAALDADSMEISVGNAGTAMRFLTAYFASVAGRCVVIDGDARMRRRPIGPLVEALKACGARIEYLGDDGFPPLRIHGCRLTGGDVVMEASVSSQYVSALMMIAPYMSEGLRLTLSGEMTSVPYIDMTLQMMQSAGASASRDGNVVTVDTVPYSRKITAVGGDWSAASYWYEIQALTAGFITLRGIEKDSMQGDRAAALIFENLGVVTDFESEKDGAVELMASPECCPRLNIDMSDTPDLAQTVVVTCALMGIPFYVSGLSTLKIKETDRLEALGSELRKIGVEALVSSDSIAWDGRRMPIMEMPEFDTYGDHRMAMAFAPVSVYVPGIVIRNAEVVEKSYPHYWEHLAAAGFTISDADIPVEGDAE